MHRITDIVKQTDIHWVYDHFKECITEIDFTIEFKKGGVNTYVAETIYYQAGDGSEFQLAKLNQGNLFRSGQRSYHEVCEIVLRGRDIYLYVRTDNGPYDGYMLKNCILKETING